ncbi:MAG: sporulation protein [Blastocatellia bacterium]|nr:sporulation protein [Blastocatellia bacterium]
MMQREDVEHSPLGDFLDRMAERFSATADVATIFGSPIERGEITVIPVAKVAYGFGGGRGQGSGGDGSGGGGGIRVSPVGYIEIRNGGAVYKPIHNWAVLIPAIAAGGILTLLCARLFRR